MKKDMKDIILENQNLIRKLAYRYSRYTNYDDLYQAGVTGIIKAYYNYKNDSNAKFSSYAYLYIKGEMLSFINMDRPIKVNSDYLKLYKAYEQNKELLTQKLGKEPTLTEVSLFMGIDESKIEDAYLACEFVSSLDKELNDEDSLSMYELVGESKENSIEARILVDDALSSLSFQERELMKLRFYKDYTQSETAEYLNISQVQVSRIEAKAKEKMRTKIAC